MVKKPTSELLEFLQAYPKEVREISLWLREYVWKLHPETNELIYDNYNALVIGFGLSEKAGDVYCSIALYGNYVNFGLLRGSEIKDPLKIFKGSAGLYRKIPVRNKEDLPDPEIKGVLNAAYEHAQKRLKQKQTMKGQVMVKSVSKKKRRPKV